MDVRLTDEQQALRDSVAHLVERHRPRSVADLEDPERRDKLEAALESSGWRELRAPSESGGPVASAVEVGIVAEELGRGLVDAPFVGPTLAVELRRCAGAPMARSAETVALAPDLSTLASSKPGSDPSPGVAVDAGRCEAALRLDADRRLVSVPTGVFCGSVDLTRPSARVGPAPTATAVEGSRALEEVDLGRWHALGLSTACADLVGVMQGALELATAYAKARRQFGVAIGSFQAVQHLLADALVSLEGSRSVARHAGWAVDALAPDESLAAAAVAKAYCGRAARAVCETAIQVHGGIGNTWECPAHLYLRRALLSIDLLGGVGPCLDRVAAGWGKADDGLR